MAMVMVYVDAQDESRLKTLVDDSYKVVEIRTDALVGDQVLLARDFATDELAETAAKAGDEMLAVPGGSVDLLKPVPTEGLVPTPGWDKTVMSSGDLFKLRPGERRTYLNTLNKMRIAIIVHAWSWIALAAAGAGFLFFTLWQVLDILKGLLIPSVTTSTTDAAKNTITNITTNTIDGWELSIIVFVLAIFVISPAVLLVLGRPLTNLDTWLPGAKPEKQKPSGDGGDTQAT